MERTLVTLGSTESCIYLRTVSRTGRSPARFFIPRDELERLESCHYITVRDLDSYATLYYREDLKTLELRLAWLSQAPDGSLAGRMETVILDWEKFHDFVLDSGYYRVETASLLSLETDFLPVLDFSDPGAQETLRRVLAVPGLKRRLICALRDGFRWSGSRTIRFFPDWDPYSFLFEEVEPDGRKGVCGGLTLRNSGSLKDAKYAVTT